MASIHTGTFWQAALFAVGALHIKWSGPQESAFMAHGSTCGTSAAASSAAAASASAAAAVRVPGAVCAKKT